MFLFLVPVSEKAAEHTRYQSLLTSQASALELCHQVSTLLLQLFFWSCFFSFKALSPMKIFRKHWPSTKSWQWRSQKWTKVWSISLAEFLSVTLPSTELRQPECFYDQAHCSAFCEKKEVASRRALETAGDVAKGSTTEDGSSLQAIRLVCQVQVLWCSACHFFFLASVENHFLVSLLMTLLVTLWLQGATGPVLLWQWWLQGFCPAGAVSLAYQCEILIHPFLRLLWPQTPSFWHPNALFWGQLTKGRSHWYDSMYIVMDIAWGQGLGVQSGTQAAGVG